MYHPIINSIISFRGTVLMLRYSSNDLAVIYSHYFSVILLSYDYLELQSINTRHCWRISKSSDNFYIILHKHKLNHSYHFHFATDSLYSSFLEIASHDQWQLNHRRTLNKPSIEKTFYDEILAIYS